MSGLYFTCGFNKLKSYLQFNPRSPTFSPAHFPPPTHPPSHQSAHPPIHSPTRRPADRADKCYCYLCDVEAKECEDWDKHCHAFDDSKEPVGHRAYSQMKAARRGITFFKVIQR